MVKDLLYRGPAIWYMVYCTASDLMPFLACVIFRPSCQRSMKHIVIIGKYYSPELGGVERYTRDVARAAAKAHRVTVVVHNKGRDDRIDQDGNITVVRCGSTKVISSQPISPSMLRHLRSLRPDLVHFNAPNFWAAGMLLLTGYQGPLMITHHADVFGRPVLKRAVMPIYRLLARRASWIIVHSLKNAKSSKDLPSKLRRVIEIPWAVDGTAYRLSDDERAVLLAQRLERFSRAPVVGFVGQFVRYKGLPVLIEALSQLNNVHALLIGDGPLRGPIEQQVQAVGITERVHFLGNLNDTDKICAMAMMDLLAMPSNDTTEAFGIVQVEAQLMGLPVVASDLPTGVTDITLHGITGFLVPPNNAEALANAFIRLFEDQTLARRLGAAGRERALHTFSLEVFNQRLSNLFGAALSGRPFDEPTICLPSSAAPMDPRFVTQFKTPISKFENP